MNVESGKDDASPGPKAAGWFRAVGIRTYLIVLVIAVLAPMMALAAGYAYFALRLQQDTIDRGMQDTARALSLAVDREVQTVEAALIGIASSPSLDAKDFAAFQAQADAVAAKFDAWVVLTSPDTMQQLVNTLRPFGAPLPKSSSPETMRRVVAERVPVVTDLIYGRVSKRNIIAVVVPVIRGDQVVYCLDITFLPDRFSRLLTDQALPEGWVGALLDRVDVQVAQSSDPPQYVGTTPVPQLVEATQGRREGVIQGIDFNDRAMDLAFHRSAMTGWKTIVAAPSAVVEMPMRRAANALAAGALGSLLIACTVAVVLGRRIARPLQTLAQQTPSMVRGEAVALPRTEIAEVADVGRALAEATDALRTQIETRIRLAEEQQARAAAEQAHAEIRTRELALRASEERYRGLTEAIASIVWTTSPDGRIAASSEWSAFTGQTQAEIAGGGWIEALHPDDRDATVAAWEHAVTTLSAFDREYRLRDASGRYRWFNGRAVPVHDATSAVREWIGVCIDIDERKAGAERQALLAAELDHRVRNILASVQAMIALTAQNAPSIEEFGRRLQGRVAAMARTHGLLTSEKWRGASLARIIRDELHPYVDDGDAVSLIGAPDCILRPRQALDFALVIHELATNAAKYGALSQAGGRIVVDWSVDGDGDAHLSLEWRESGGPEVKAPSRRGFGSRLLESALGQPPDADVALEFLPSGLRCRIRMRLISETPPAQRVVRQKQVEQQQDAVLTPAQAAGARVLVAEDEPLAALEISSTLTQAGFDVVGPVQSLREAVDLARNGPLAAAVLDVNLQGDMVFPAADVLTARGVPLVFVTGYDADAMLHGRYPAARTLRKPVDHDRLTACVRALVRGEAKRERS